MKNKISYGTQQDSILKTFIGLSRTTQGLHKRAGNIFKKGGLTSSQFAVLEALYHKGDLTIQEIIDSVLSTSGNMTVVIHNLEKEKLIKRHKNPMDKRSSLIAITDKGREIVSQIFPMHLQDLVESFDALTKEELDTMLSILRKVKL